MSSVADPRLPYAKTIRTKVLTCEPWTQSASQLAAIGRCRAAQRCLISDTVDELLSAEEFPAEFDESVDNSTLYAEYRRLAAEQAALRRLASLVARGVEPSEVFEAVTDEMRRCVQATRAGLLRYESNGEVTIVGAAYDSDPPLKSPVGTRFPIGSDTLAAVVRRTGRAARLDTYANVAGPLAARMRDAGVRATVAVPVIVDGNVWGLAVVGSMQPVPMPAGTEARIGRFAELIAGAVVAGYRDEQKRQLLDEGSRRPFLIESLLDGRVVDEWSLWEVANHLRLPTHGPFVVIAAEVPTVGTEALPDVESKLRSLDVYSAWRLLPDLHVGIVHVELSAASGQGLGPGVSADGRSQSASAPTTRTCVIHHTPCISRR